jgi:hypothetical protein
MSDKRRNAVDPAVAAALSDVSRQQRRRRMSKQQRQDNARSRTYYDVPPAIKDAILQIADREGLSASGVATILLAYAARQYLAGNISLDGLKRPSRSPRTDWVIEEEQAEAVLQGSRSLEPRKEKK